MSLNVVYTEESIKEIRDLLNSPKYYLTPEGTMAYSADDDVINLVLAHMTDEPNKVDMSKEDNLAEESPEDTSIQAKFSESSLVKLISMFRYLGINCKIPIEDLHITLFHSNQPFVYQPVTDINYSLEVDKIDNIGGSVAMIVKSDELKNRRDTINTSKEFIALPLHFDIDYSGNYSTSVLTELNIKLNKYKELYGSTFYCDKEIKQ